MRMSATLTLLAAVLTGCTDDLPTAPSADGPAAIRAEASAVVLPFRGTFETTHTSSYDPSTGMGHIHLVGTGTATHLGKFTLVSEIVIDPTTVSGTEHAILTAANGDLLVLDGTTQGAPAGDGTLSAESVLTITGGTGRFAGATGNLILTQVNLAPDAVARGRMEGTIQLARPVR